MNYQRTHHLGELRASHIGQSITLSGWVHRRRDHGGLIFIDLRDRFGITQLIIDPKTHPEGEKLRSEWVISVQGKVIPRAEGMTNPKMATGEIEIEVSSLNILSKAKTPPFSISDQIDEVSEDLRLKYRYLDMRREVLTSNLKKRHEVMLKTRQYLDSQGFMEVSTPILARSTPEGARDYLVPSRIYPGNFYALPQSPQIFKQLLMIGGMDRYFQIAPCFRDEDLRADRQPEFTQIDLEMSFGKPEDIKNLIEGWMKTLFDNPKFEVMSHADCMESYGTDRPDLRFGMKFHRIDDIAKASDFTVFKEQECVKGICVPGGAEMSRREVDRLAEFVGQFGLKGLGWMKYQDGAFSSSIVKFFGEDLLEQMRERFEVQEGDLLLFAAEKESVVNQALDHLRRHLARERNLIPENTYKFLWVVDFPLFEWDEDEKRLSSVHHPFTAPHEDDLHLLDTEPLKVRTHAYDLVLNGSELGGGSQRIHDCDLQEKIFKLLSLSDEEVHDKFGFFIDALKYGTPPHLGIAFGLDRLMMILCNTESIRDVIAFPKTQKASDIMMQCPSSVADKQLNELKIASDAKEITWT